MPGVLYVGLQEANQIAVFAIDDAGKLAKQGEMPVAGGPSVMAVGHDRRMLYVGQRDGQAIAAFRIDPQTGRLSAAGTSAQRHAPTFLALDRTGRFMLVAYYQGGGAAVFRLADNGTVGAPSQDWLATEIGAHAIATDRSNRFAYVPHIARIQDNVLEPPKNIPGLNTIMQFRFDVETGRLSPNSPPQVAQANLAGPRHYCFHPSLDLVYFSNEQGCSVTSYRVNPGDGTLAPVQTISTLPAGFGDRNTCSQIHLTASGGFLYVGNRGHNSIAGFSVAPDTGFLTPAGHAPTEAVPSAFCLRSQPLLTVSGISLPVPHEKCALMHTEPRASASPIGGLVARKARRVCPTAIATGRGVPRAGAVGIAAAEARFCLTRGIV